MLLPDVSQLRETYARRCISPEDTLDLADEDIEKHSAFLVTLKRYRNEFAPVSCLPPEILCRIFAILQLEICEGQDEDSEYDISSSLTRRKRIFPPHIRWISVTHVHSHWRNVALDWPTLWTEPPINTRWSSSWITTMLQRSQTAALSIHSPYEYHFYASKEFPLQHTSRIIKYLAVNLNVNRIADSMKAEQLRLDEWLTLSATPALETLWIDGNKENVYPLRMKVPASIFLAGAADNLRKLEIMKCIIDGPLHLPGTITHLKMHSVKHNMGFSDLIRTLGGLKELKVLDLEDFHLSGKFPTKHDANHWNVIPYTNSSLIASEGGSTHNVSVCLPRLTELRICSVNTSVEAFFRHVTFPASAEVQVNAFPLQVPAGEKRFPEDVSARLFANIAQSYSTLDPSAVTTNFQSLIIDYPSSQSYPRKATDDQWVRFTVLRNQIKASEVALYKPFKAIDKIQGYPLMILWYADFSDYGYVGTAVSNFFKSGLPMLDPSFVHIMPEVRRRCTDGTLLLAGLKKR